MKYIKLFEDSNFYLNKRVDQYMDKELEYINKYASATTKDFEFDDKKNILSFSVYIEEGYNAENDIFNFYISPGPLSKFMIESVIEDLMEEFEDEFEDIEVIDDDLDERVNFQFSYYCSVKEHIARSGKAGLWDLKTDKE